MLRKFQIQHIFYKKSLKVLDDTGESLHLQHQYSKSLSRAENFSFPSKSVNDLLKFSAQDSDLEYLFWQCKKTYSIFWHKATFSLIEELLAQLQPEK